MFATGSAGKADSGTVIVVNTFNLLPATAVDGQLAIVRLPTPRLYEFDAASMTWLLVGGVGNLLGAAGSQAIGNGSSSVSVVLATARPALTYEIMWSIKNIVDSQPIFLLGFISAQTVNGFTITFNAPTDSADYILQWMVADDV